MNEVQDIEELQKVVDYRLVRKNLKWPAIGSIIWGLIAIGAGFGSIEDSSIYVILGLIGAFLLVEGIWLIRAPSPRGMIVDGIALCILGVWNISVTFVWPTVVGAGRADWAAVLGVLQIIWGIQSFRRYRRFSGVPTQKPSEQTMKQADEIIQSVAKTKPSESKDIIQFQMTRGGFGWKSWRGKLSGDVGVFVTSSGDDAIFARRDEVDFISKGKVPISLPGKTLKVSARIGRGTFKAAMPPESMARYESWKEIPVERREVRKEALAKVSSKSRLATTLLCVLPACLFIHGIHRFYLGKIGTGIAMLLTLGGLGFWTLIDFIFAVSGNMKDKDGNLIKNW